MTNSNTQHGKNLKYVGACADVQGSPEGLSIDIPQGLCLSFPLNKEVKFRTGKGKMADP